METSWAEKCPTVHAEPRPSLPWNFERERGPCVYESSLELLELDILAHCIQGASSGSIWFKDHPGWVSTDCFVLGEQTCGFQKT